MTEVPAWFDRGPLIIGSVHLDMFGYPPVLLHVPKTAEITFTVASVEPSMPRVGVYHLCHSDVEFGRAVAAYYRWEGWK